MAVKFIYLLAAASICILSDNGLSATYYLDASAINTLGNGTLSSPWKTLSQAQGVVVQGDTVNVSTGDYGMYYETDVVRSDYITYQALPGNTVKFDGVSINNSESSNSYLKFVGIHFKPDWVDPCATSQPGCSDPQYVNSTTTTYAKTADIIHLSNANYVQIVGSYLEGQNRYLTPTGVYTLNSSNITVSGCDIKNVISGIKFLGNADNSMAIGNDIHGLASTALSSQVGMTTRNILFERNHAHDGVLTTAPDYAPKKSPISTYGYHASGVSIRNGDVTVRGNIIHNMASSAGIKLYEDESDFVNDNVLIENNLIYDLGALIAISISEAGPNIAVKNNTVIAQSRFDTNGGNAQFRTAFTVSSVDEQLGPADVQVHNNIMIGIAGLTAGCVTESNNVVWTTSTSTISPIVSPSTHVMTSSYSYYPWDKLKALFASQNIVYENYHGLILDFRLGSESLALNRGDVEQQPERGLGVLDANSAFIQDSNPLRSSGDVMAGAYGYGALYLQANLVGSKFLPFKTNGKATKAPQ